MFCGTLTMVPLSTLPRSIICLPLLSLPLREILLQAPINSSYLVKGGGQIVLTATNGFTFTLLDAILVVKFLDDRCNVHDLTYVDTIVASCLLFCRLYKLVPMANVWKMWYVQLYICKLQLQNFGMHNLVI